MRAKALVFSLFIISGLACASQAQQVTYKISQTMSMEGMPQPISTTTYVKGARKRTEQGAMMGMGGDVATIEQCDLKQNVQVNDKKRLYHVDPMDDGNGSAPSRGTGTGAGTGSGRSTAYKKGGTVTVTNNITDTGERKQMFGMTARHLKTSVSMEASPDACMQGNMKTETDGWYIDLPEFSCPVPFRPMQGGPGARGGCQDRFISRSTGGGKLGFPLEQTMSMNGMTQTIHTVDFSRAPLDQMLFDVPTGYTAVTDTNQLYGQPDMAAMMRAAQNGGGNDDDQRNSSSRSMGNSRGAMPGFNGIKVAVLVPTNRGDNVSTSDLQSYLVERLSGGNVMGVAVSSEAEARSMGATYILWSDISKLKQSTAGKIGGVFGRATGAPTGGNYDAQVDYKLVKLADGSTALSSKAASKSESDIQRAAETILGQEATAVLGVAR
jgi:hypothetical protein